MELPRAELAGRKHAAVGCRVLGNAVHARAYLKAAASQLAWGSWGCRSAEALRPLGPQGTQGDSPPAQTVLFHLTLVWNARIFIFCVPRGLRSWEAPITFTRGWSKNISCYKMKYMTKSVVKYMWGSVLFLSRAAVSFPS